MRKKIFVQELGKFNFYEASQDTDRGINRFDRFVRQARVSSDIKPAEIDDQERSSKSVFIFLDGKVIELGVASCQTPGSFCDKQSNIYLVYPQCKIRQ